jgi:hypothetical protein
MAVSLMDIVAAQRAGVPVARGMGSKKPVYFTEKNRLDPKPYYPHLKELSRQCWAYMGYAGYLTPWHDSDAQNLLEYSRDKFRALFYKLDKEDIPWWSYFLLLFLMTSYEKWERPGLLMSQEIEYKWFRKLRTHVGSSQNFHKVALFMWEFTQLQVQQFGRCVYSRSTFIDTDPASVQKLDKKKTAYQEDRAKALSENRKAPRQSMDKAPQKYLVAYHRIFDRIRALDAAGVDYLEWLRVKFGKCVECHPNEYVKLNTIINMNGLDPELKAIQQQANDPWKHVRKFLGLSEVCAFPDGSIPKGWRAASDDADDLRKVVRILADGYYYYADGTQRRGKRHYAQNKYLVIRCTPENFNQLVADWDDARKLTSRPTWSEYSQWGLYPSLWDAQGQNVSEFTAIPDVKWRHE